VAVTPDDRLAISASWDKTLKVWDLHSGQVLATFIAESAVCACAAAPDRETIVAGEASGRIHFLRLEGVVPEAPLVTAWASPGDVGAAIGCPRCRTWSAVQRSSLGQPVTCPLCGHALQLNPFVIEADWRPVAKAWKTDPGE